MPAKHKGRWQHRLDGSQETKGELACDDDDDDDDDVLQHSWPSSTPHSLCCFPSLCLCVPKLSEMTFHSLGFQTDEGPETRKRAALPFVNLAWVLLPSMPMLP